jgi:hypothetical protein
MGSGWDSGKGRLLARVGLGAVTHLVPLGLVDEVLAETGKTQGRFRDLPHRLGVYVVLGLCLFSSLSYTSVLAQMTAGVEVALGGLGWRRVSSTALTKLRRRLGPEPFAVLFQRLTGQVTGRLAAARREWSHAFGLLLVAVDGTTIDLSDTPGNVEEFGKPVNKHGEPGPFPQARLVVLLACGARRLLGAAFGPLRGKDTGERVLAGQLLGYLRSGMLLLADRGFYSYQLWEQATATGAQLLWRLQLGKPQLRLVRVLGDGSWLAWVTDPADARRWARNVRRNRKRGHRPPKPRPLNGRLIRVIDAKITVTGEDGTTRTETYRLATTLLDPDRAPAGELVAVYAQRWAIEVGLREFKTYLRGTGRLLRGHDPDLVRQEIWAYLCLYQLIRLTVCQAAARAGLDPDRISFTAARDALRRAIATTPHDAAQHHDWLVSALARELVTKHRRWRLCPRALKNPFRQFPAKQGQKQPASQHTSHHTDITNPPATAPPQAA